MSGDFLQRIVVTALLAGLVVSMAAPAAAQSTQPSMTVELYADGSARVTVVYTFDLTTDNETDAFEQLRNNSTERALFRESFRSRMSRVANASENETGREMAVSNASIDLRRDNRTGIAELAVDWSGLAAGEGETLVVTEPFASEFTTDRTLTMVLPEGYAVDSASPTPDSQNATAATYDAGTDLDGFELRASPTATTTTAAGTAGGTDTAAGTATATATGTTTGNGPGFGPVAALVALACLALLSRD